MSDVREVLAEAAAQLETADTLLEHGKRWAYQCGCRCRPCSEANTAYQARYRRRQLEGKPLLGARVNGDATAKRIRALRKEGYTVTRLALLIGVHVDTLLDHCSSRPVWVRTAVRVAKFWRDQQLPE